MQTNRRIILGSLALLVAACLLWTPGARVSESPKRDTRPAAARPSLAAWAEAAPARAGGHQAPASTSLPAPAAPMAAVVSAEEKDSVAAQIHGARRWFAQTLRADGDAALVATVDGPAGFALEADARGVEVRPPGGAAWAWRMKPVEGRPVAPRAEKERLSYERSAGVTEWFVNGADGVEHGYTLAAENGAAVRRVSAVVETGLRAVLRAGRDGVDFLDESGAARLHYDGLMAFDAVGRKLEAWMETKDQTDQSDCLITLAVNTTDARFPVTIDPIISLAGAAIQPSPVEAADGFATSMDVAGDLLVVSAPARDVPGNGNGGAAFVFKRDAGTAFGWTQVANLTLPATVRAFGKKVAVGGNLLAVACEHDDPAPGVIDEVRLYTLDSAGAATPLTTLVIGENVAGFDHSVEVSADGSLVAVGSTSLRYNGDPGALRAGRVLVFGRDEGGPGNWGLATALQTPTYATGYGFNFGYSLSLSGDWLAVGAPSLLGERVFVYSRSGSVWTLDATFTPPAVTAPVAVQGFGKTVALHGNRLAIGAPDSNSNGEPSGFNTGRVIVAERRANGSWVTGSLLPAPSIFGGDQFGAVLSMSANQLSIAGPGASSLWSRKSFTSSDAADGWSLEREDSLASLGLSAAITSLHQSDGTVLTGSATAGKIVARRLVASNWPITAQFTEGAAAHLAGAALARDGDLLAIGAPGDTGTHDRSVYVLRRNTSAAPGQEWTLAHTFTDNTAGFGSSLALKDGILLIGAPGFGNGVVLCYRRQNAAATAWTPAQLLFPPVTFPAAAFGTAISFNGVFAVVGDPLANSGGGGAVVFQRPASGEWPVVMGGTVAAPYRGYGAAVALTEGNHFIVGAPQTPVLADSFPADGGAVFVWRYEPVASSLDASSWTPAWTLDQHLYPDGSVSARSDGRFGASVAMQGQQAFIGAPGDGTAAQRGRVFVFRRDETPLPPADPVPTQVPWRQIATIFPGNLTDTPPDAPFFGHAIALNNAHVAIGAPGDATHAGQVFVYSAAPAGLLWAPIARMLAPASAVGDGFGLAVAAPIMDEIAVGAPGIGVSIFTKQLSEWRLVRNVPTQTQSFTNLLPLGFGEGPLAVGTSLATDGDWLVVGAPRVIHTTSSGVAPVVTVVDPWKQVFVLHRRSPAGVGSDAWETTTVLAFGGNTWSYGTSLNHNRTGLSVDISGQNIIVGEGSNVDNGGRTYIARLNADGTQPQLELTPDGYLGNEGFERLQTAGGSSLVGHAVAISGSYAAVGSGDGSARIYEWRGWHDPQLVGGGLAGTRQWKLVKTLERSFEARGFGSAVALDGLRLAVGADQHENEGGGSDGMVLIFERDFGGSNNWGQRAELTTPEPMMEEGGYLGMGGALALEGDTLVAGAKGSVGEGYTGLPNGNFRTFGSGGTAFVFERHAGGTDNWGFTAQLYGTGSIGVSVAISGDIIALGSPGGVFSEWQEGALPGLFDLVGPYFQRGKVTLFHRHQKTSSSGAVEAVVPAWGDIASFEQENPAATHTFNFGGAVALSGGTLAIGAPGTVERTVGWNYSSGGIFAPGRAFVHDLRLTGTQQWRNVWLPDVIAPATGGTPYSGTFNPNGLDFDADGLVNLMEQFHGLNPFIADAQNGGILSSALAAGDFVLTWREALNHGLTAVPQWSRNIAQWHDTGTGPAFGDEKTFTVTTLSTQPDFVIKQARVPVAGEGLFFVRLSVRE